MARETAEETTTKRVYLSAQVYVALGQHQFNHTESQVAQRGSVQCKMRRRRGYHSHDQAREKSQGTHAHVRVKQARAQQGCQDRVEKR